MKLALALLAAACNRASSTGAADVEAPSVAVVDDAIVSSCTIAYSCGLSHPGLGSSSRSTSIDLSTCAKTTSSESGPYDPTLAPLETSSKKPAPSTLSGADCARVRAAATAVTQADARAAQESAQIDTEACMLTLQCKGEPTARLQVQRQTTTGPSRVEKLIRAVLQ